MEQKIENILSGKPENHILPFLWMMGEDISVTLEQLHAIRSCGIGAVCLESRTFEDFCGDSWWTVLRAVLEEARTLGMKVWVLDDKHFPTGYAVGAIEKKYPERRQKQLAERHLDIIGPRRIDAIASGFEKDDTFLGAVAVRRDERGERLTNDAVVLKEENGYISFDCPEGCWRLFTFWHTYAGGRNNYISMVDDCGTDTLIETVYEPHYAHAGEYFGKEFAGFFSDEPSMGNSSLVGGGPSYGMYRVTVGQPGLALPWARDMETGDLTRLPLLWYEGDGCEEVREAYMDRITRLYGERFTKRLGDWCRAHGVEYIGHIIEDKGAHARLGCSAGHYFRALEGQDMGGIDIVLHQVMPGFADHDSSCIAASGKTDSKFYHYTLGKLASSLAHIRSHMRNRAMCEVFGAYGWAEDMPTMKWLIDYLLVRGVNQFVPHAFSPVYPNPDCPPHFYTYGDNPQFDDFAELMRYTNTAADLLTGNRVCRTAVLYHAEAEWSGRPYMPIDDVARELTDHQIDFDFVPADDVLTAKVENGLWKCGSAAFDTLVIPEAAYLPENVIEAVNRLGIRVLQVNSVTPGLHAECVPEALVSKAVRGEVKLKAPASMLRYTRVVREDGASVLMFFNESVCDRVDTEALVPMRGGYLKADLMGASYTRGVCAGSLPLHLAPYESVLFVFDGKDLPADEEPEFVSEPVSALWKIETARCEIPDLYEPFADSSEPVTVEKKLPDFCGTIRYTARINESGVTGLEITEPGDTAHVFVNGADCGRRYAPPYTFDVSEAWQDGKNEVQVVIATTLARKHKDIFSLYMPLNRPGFRSALLRKKK